MRISVARAKRCTGLRDENRRRHLLPTAQGFDVWDNLKATWLRQMYCRGTRLVGVERKLELRTRKSS